MDQAFSGLVSLFFCSTLDLPKTKPQLQTDAERNVPKLAPSLIAVFKSVMFIYGSLCYTVIAAFGKGPSLLRVFSFLQKTVAVLKD